MKDVNTLSTFKLVGTLTEIAREKQGDQIRNAVKEINTLKQELFEIKKMIKEGFKK